jgi:RES domain-containing protein
MLPIYRICDSRHPVWDGTGAAMVGGRWNSPGQPVIYGALSYACAMLEILVHANIGRVPATHGHVVAEVPDHVALERIGAAQLPAGWDSDDITIARQVGDQWLKEARTAVLIVPSVVVRLEWIAVVNPQHPDANQLSVSSTQPVVWDQRLFGRSNQ